MEGIWDVAVDFSGVPVLLALAGLVGLVVVECLVVAFA